jgi:transposase
MLDAATSALRRQVLRRAHIVRQRTRLKNQVHAILARNLVPRCPAADLFGIKGRHWLAHQDLPPDERDAASVLLRQLDFHAQELALIDKDLGHAALSRPAPAVSTGVSCLGRCPPGGIERRFCVSVRDVGTSP